MNQKALILHYNFYETVKMLSDHEAGALFKALFDYDINGTEPVFEDRTVLIVFLQMKNLLDSNREKYEQMCKKRSENAKKRWQTLISNEEAVQNMQVHTATGKLNTNTNINTNIS